MGGRHEDGGAGRGGEQRHPAPVLAIETPAFDYLSQDTKTNPPCLEPALPAVLIQGVLSPVQHLGIIGYEA